MSIVLRDLYLTNVLIKLIISSFGCFLRSPSTGIILNDEMDDFSKPGERSSEGLLSAPANFIKPGKHPISSMCPTIVIDADGNVRLVIGASGANRIMPSLAFVVIHHLFLNVPLEEAIDMKRLHHQLTPMWISHEEGYNKTILDFLSSRGHEMKESDFGISGFSAVLGISKSKGRVEAYFDKRRGGSTSFF